MPCTHLLSNRNGAIPDSHVTGRGYDRDYYARHRATGLDLLAYGLWQQKYGRWIVDALQLKGQHVLDVGCACGGMLRGIWQAGADIEGIDCSEVLVQMGREHWPDMADRLWINDAVNLHSIPDATFDWLHSCVVAEHWIPELVPHIFKELRRVVKPGGYFYCAYEDEGGAMASGRDPADEPTHICLKESSWWEEYLRQTDWEIVSENWRDALRDHPDSFFKEYRWAWFVAHRKDGTGLTPGPNAKILPQTQKTATPPQVDTKVQIFFRHGLGDAIQLTTVLLHLQKYRPSWSVDVVASIGKHSAFRGLCQNVFIQERDHAPCCHYQRKFDLEWHECHDSYGDSPSTKAERCLRDEFGIHPDPALCRYSIEVTEGARRIARKYLDRICESGPQAIGKYPAVLIHYEGNTSADRKNIPVDIVHRVCADILELGFIPIILDWDYRTPLADPQSDGRPSRIHVAHVKEELWRDMGTGDADVLAALIELSTLMVGVDSGPLHVAGAVSTPTIGVWTHHHPYHYFGHADNVTHLVPIRHAELIHGNRSAGEAYFTKHYRFQEYADLETSLRLAVRTKLGQEDDYDGLIFTRGFWIRDDNADQDLTIIRDVVEEDCYHVNDMTLPGPIVVDIGAHIGCFSKRLYQQFPNARIFTVECCPENVPALRKNIDGFAEVIQAAVTYDSDVALLNSVHSNCRSTGGSALLDRRELEKRVASGEMGIEPGGDFRSEYWADFRPMQKVTLEDLMRQHGFDQIDVLKLDCEGSEYSILGKTPSLDRIGLIVGEYHGKEKFERLVIERFAGWELRVLNEGHLGTFWLTNPAYKAHESPKDSGAMRNGAASHSDITIASQDSPQSPEAAVIQMDGFRELLARLRQAATSSDRILVAGYTSRSSIRQACDTFTTEHPEFARRKVHDGFLVFERKQGMNTLT